MFEPIAPILIRLPTAADPATLWSALTVPARVAAWFAIASPLGDIGTPYTLEFGDGSLVDGILRELVPGLRFGYSWHWHGVPAAETTWVRWDVEPTGDGRSAVILHHDGWAEAGLTTTDREDHRSAWQEYLDGLLEMLAGEA